MTAQDHMFSRSLAALVRFEPGVAVDMHRRFAREVVDRTDAVPARQGVTALLRDSAILETDTINRLIEIGRAASSHRHLTETGDIHDGWLTGQYALRAAFPYLTGNEQLKVIEGLSGRDLLVDLLRETSAAGESELEACLKGSIDRSDADALSRGLAFSHYSRSPLSTAARSILAGLITSTDRGTRTQVFALAARTRDADLLKRFLASGWDAANCHPKEGFFELWYGSRCLLAAAESGLIDIADAVGRMGLNFYGFAAETGTAGAKAVAARVEVALRRATGMNHIPQFPLVEQPATTDEDQDPPMVSLVDQPPSRDIRDVFDRLGETSEAFQQRHRESWNAFDRFVEQITLADARLLLDDLSWRGFDAIVDQEPQLALDWKGLLLSQKSVVFSSLHAFATALARALAPIDAAAAGQLFDRIAKESSIVNRVIGASAIPADAVAIWSRASIPEIRSRCFDRLDRATDDALMAAEVMAAHVGGSRDALVEYVDARLAVGEPVPTARALVVSGFSDVNDHAGEVLTKFENHAGFVGDAHRSAIHAYRRNEWARHWYEQMRVTESREDFWRYATLFVKIVDGRYDLWAGDFGTPKEAFLRFIPTFQEATKRRIVKWRSARQSKLFGLEIPDPIFTIGRA